MKTFYKFYNNDETFAALIPFKVYNLLSDLCENPEVKVNIYKQEVMLLDSLEGKYWVVKPMYVFEKKFDSSKSKSIGSFEDLDYLEKTYELDIKVPDKELSIYIPDFKGNKIFSKDEELYLWGHNLKELLNLIKTS